MLPKRYDAELRLCVVSNGRRLNKYRPLVTSTRRTMGQKCVETPRKEERKEQRKRQIVCGMSEMSVASCRMSTGQEVRFSAPSSQSDDGVTQRHENACCNQQSHF
jgi:hypothetical protein